MSSTTVAEFANELKKTPETLLEQLEERTACQGRPSPMRSPRPTSRSLLGYLQASHGTVEPERKKITLIKKSTSEIKQADATGKRPHHPGRGAKKRTFIKRGEGPAAAPEAAPQQVAEAPAAAPVAPPPPAAPRIDEAELARREEERRAARPS